MAFDWISKTNLKYLIDKIKGYKVAVIRIYIPRIIIWPPYLQFTTICVCTEFNLILPRIPLVVGIASCR